MFDIIVSTLSWALLAAALIIGLTLIYGVVRKQPPFKPGTEPKHSWDMTRAERIAQLRESRAADEGPDPDEAEARRRDEWANYGLLKDDLSLKGFDPKLTYARTEDMEPVTWEEQQRELERIGTLITHMTILRASPPEMARAVRHSMVVVDSHKHQLNYKQSEIDNGIGVLEEKYN
jgi:hypothetical protein